MNPLNPSETSIRDFLAAVASAEEPHGAVSAAALAAGLGCSLLLMVATLPKTKSDTIEERRMLIEAAAALSSVQEQLMETIEVETAVKVFAARSMPQGTKTERRARQTAIQFALRAAADVPLEVMRLCAAGLNHAKTVAQCGTQAASAEVGLGLALLFAAFDGVRLYLESRIPSLTDAGYVTAVVDEMSRLNGEATTAVSVGRSSLRNLPA